MKNGDMPTAPMLNEHGCPQHYSSILVQQGQVTGLTKRELIAAMAMQGFLANKAHATHFMPEHDARYCIQIADALLAELEQIP